MTTCPKCAAQLEPDDAYCPGCGSGVQNTQRTPTPPQVANKLPLSVIDYAPFAHYMRFQMVVMFIAALVYRDKTVDVLDMPVLDYGTAIAYVYWNWRGIQEAKQYVDEQRQRGMQMYMGMSAAMHALGAIDNSDSDVATWIFGLLFLIVDIGWRGKVLTGRWWGYTLHTRMIIWTVVLMLGIGAAFAE